MLTPFFSVIQFSRKTGSAVPTRWSEEEIEIALEGEHRIIAKECSFKFLWIYTDANVVTVVIYMQCGWFHGLTRPKQHSRQIIILSSFIFPPSSPSPLPPIPI